MLLRYPNQVVNKKAVVLRRQSAFSSFIQIASMMLHVKKGTQQIKKTPVSEENRVNKNVIQFYHMPSRKRWRENAGDRSNKSLEKIICNEI